MSFSQLPFTTGTAKSQAITFNAGAYDFSATRKVLLSSNYTRVIPPGYPDANAGTKESASPTAFPQTIASGKTVTFYTPEAQALVTAGAGSFA